MKAFTNVDVVISAWKRVRVSEPALELPVPTSGPPVLSKILITSALNVDPVSDAVEVVDESLVVCALPLNRKSCDAVKPAALKSAFEPLFSSDVYFDALKKAASLPSLLLL